MPHITTCSNCPLSNSLDNNRLTCEATHKQGLEVVRGHWGATRDCNDAIAQHQARTYHPATTDCAVQQHQATVDFADGKLAGYLDAKNKSNSIPENASEHFVKGYWVGFDSYLESIKSHTAPFHLTCTYHVHSDLYQVRRQGKTIYMGRNLPTMAIGVRVQNIYR